MADPFDKELSGLVAKAVRAEGVLEGDGVKLHENGTVVCIGKCSKPPFVLFQHTWKNTWKQGPAQFDKLTAY